MVCLFIRPWHLFVYLTETIIILSEHPHRRSRQGTQQSKTANRQGEPFLLHITLYLSTYQREGQSEEEQMAMAARIKGARVACMCPATVIHELPFY